MGTTLEFLIFRITESGTIFTSWGNRKETPSSHCPHSIFSYLYIFVPNFSVASPLCTQSSSLVPNLGIALFLNLFSPESSYPINPRVLLTLSPKSGSRLHCYYFIAAPRLFPGLFLYFPNWSLSFLPH